MGEDAIYSCSTEKEIPAPNTPKEDIISILSVEKIYS
jgi:hypothetical protein